MVQNSASHQLCIMLWELGCYKYACVELRS